MALPTMRSGLVSREFLRVAGGYGAPSLGTSPAGGLDIDNAGNFATDGDGVMNTLQLGANVIKNSQGETTVTLDVNQNVSLENDLYFNGGGNIGTDTDTDLLAIADNALTINGSLLVSEYVSHLGDSDTYLRFTDDFFRIYAGGIRGLDVSATYARFNFDGADYDFWVNGANVNYLLMCDAGTDRVGIGTPSPGTELDVNGDLTVRANSILGNASTDTITCTGRLLIRSVTDAGPMTATAGTVSEIVYNTSDSKFYGCTATGSPATWSALN